MKKFTLVLALLMPLVAHQFGHVEFRIPYAQHHNPHSWLETAFEYVHKIEFSQKTSLKTKKWTSKMRSKNIKPRVIMARVRYLLFFSGRRSWKNQNKYSKFNTSKLMIFFKLCGLLRKPQLAEFSYATIPL